MIKTLAISDYAYRPGPRYERQGPKSAEEYRKTILTPAIREAIDAGGKVLVNLDSTGGLGRSFLEEISGGLIREDRIPFNEIMNHVEFIANELPVYKMRVTHYLNAAHEEEGI